MCRPPDISPQFTAVNFDRGNRTEGNEIYAPVSDFNATEPYSSQAAEFDTTFLDDFSVQEEANSWMWPNQAQAVGNHATGRQVMKPGDPLCGGFPNPANDSVFGLSQEKNPWEMNSVGSIPAHSAKSWRSSVIPVAPPRPLVYGSVSSAPVGPQIPSVMAGPSLGGYDCQSGQGLPAPWSSAVVSDIDQSGIDCWMNSGVAAGVKPQYSVCQAAAKPKEGGLSQELSEKLAFLSENCSENADQKDEAESEDDENTKNKKMRRMLSNRASAKRSRQRRQERLGELEIQTAQLRVENASLSRKLNEAVQEAKQCKEEKEALQAELNVVRAQLSELKGQSHVSGPGYTFKIKDESGHEAISVCGTLDKDVEVMVKKAHALVESSQGSPSSNASNEARKASTGVDDLDVGFYGKDLCTDDWFESLVQSFDD